MSGDDYPDICLAVAQGQPFKFEAVCRSSQERPSLFALTFDNGYDDRGAAVKRLSGNNPATS